MTSTKLLELWCLSGGVGMLLEVLVRVGRVVARLVQPARGAPHLEPAARAQGACVGAADAGPAS